VNNYCGSLPFRGFRWNRENVDRSPEFSSAWVKSYQLCFFNFCVLVLMPDDCDDFNVLVLAFVAGFEALLTPNGAVCLERKWTRLVQI